MKRKIAAIFAADIAGYSRLVAEDEEETLRRLAAYRAVVDDFILDVRANKTSLRLLGSGIPDAPAWDQGYTRIRMGWERFLARIKVTLESPPAPKPVTIKDPHLPGLDY